MPYDSSSFNVTFEPPVPGGGPVLPLPPVMYLPAPPVPGPLAPPSAPTPVSHVPTIPVPSFRTVAPVSVVRGSYSPADMATQLRKARVQASIDSRADLRTLQERLRELMELQSNARQLRARQIAAKSGVIGSVVDKDLQQAMKLADKEIKELEKRISKARSLEEPTSAASSAVENGNRAMQGALDLFEHRYDVAGEEPIAPFGGPSGSMDATTAAEFVDQNWRKQKLQVRDSFGMNRLMTAEEIINDPDIRMSTSKVKALAREKAEAEWDVRHAPSVQRGTPGGPAPGPVAGGFFVEAVQAVQQVARTGARDEAESYAVGQETQPSTIEEAEAQLPFVPYASRQAVAFEAGAESLIPSVPSSIIKTTKVQRAVSEGVMKDFSDWRIPEAKELGITESTTSESATPAQFREMSRVLSWIPTVIDVGMKKGKQADRLDVSLQGQVKKQIGDTIKQRYGAQMKSAVLKTMDPYYPMGARYQAAKQVAELLRQMEQDSFDLAMEHPYTQAAIAAERSAQAAGEYGTAAVQASREAAEAVQTKVKSMVPERVADFLNTITSDW